MMEAVQRRTAGTRFAAPAFITSFYSKFPLVTLEQEDELEWKVRARQGAEQGCELWIHPPSAIAHAHHRSWASASPSSLRTQLLFLLRDSAARVPVNFRNWANENAAPGGTLPSLHLPAQERLLATDEIRGWLDGAYPLKGKVLMPVAGRLQGLPSQEAYDRALALSHLILGHLHPAYLASLPSNKRPAEFHLLFPTPPPLLAGLTTPLPASLTGDARDIDTAEVIRKGVEAIEGIEVILAESDRWALGARHPTPLDALIASQLYVVYSLPETALLRSAISTKDSLGSYLDRVLDYAGERIGPKA